MGNLETDPPLDFCACAVSTSLSGRRRTQRGKVCASNPLQSVSLAANQAQLAISLSPLLSQMPGKAHSPRNYLLAGGISRYSRSAMYRKKALYKRKRVEIEPTKEKRKHYKIKPVKGEKNGKTRVVLLKKTVNNCSGV